MTTRRGLLRFLAAAGIVAIAPSVPKIAAPVKSILPPPVTDSFETYTFKREPGFFDVSTYRGNGASATIPHTLGSALGFVMIKCRSKVGDWHMLEVDDVVPTLPAEFNEDGHNYIAYQFGKKSLPQIQPYIDKLRKMQA
jgi:hypothetical protein